MQYVKATNLYHMYGDELQVLYDVKDTWAKKILRPCFVKVVVMLESQWYSEQLAMHS